MNFPTLNGLLRCMLYSASKKGDHRCRSSVPTTTGQVYRNSATERFPFSRQLME